MTEAHSVGDSAPTLETPEVPEQSARVDLEKPGAKDDPGGSAPPAVPTGTADGAAPAERITFQSMAERLTLGLLAAVIGAVLVFVSAFLTWSTVDARSAAGNKIAGAVTDSIGIAGGRLGTATLVLSIISLAIVAVMLLPATKPWAWQALFGSGILIVLFALIDALSIPRTLRPDNFTCPSGVSCSFHRSIGPGVWFTLIAGLVVVAGAYVHHIRPVPFRPGTPGGSHEPAAVAEPAVAQPVAESAQPAADVAAESSDQPDEPDAAGEVRPADRAGPPA